MKLISFFFLFTLIFITNNFSQEQIKDSLSGEQNHPGLENIFVETYYINDTVDSINNTYNIPRGFVTYRIFVDMAAGYKLQAVYGVPGHVLRFETTTEFFNDKVNGAKTGKLIKDRMLDKKTVALDSWLTLGSASSSYLGIPKKDDYDGSILHFSSLDKKDGLTEGATPPIELYKIDLDFFNIADTSVYNISDGVIATNHGIEGPTPKNYVLVAQLTTDGILSYEFNVQLIAPDGNVEQYVAHDPNGKEILFNGLKNNYVKTNNYETKTFTQN